MTRTERDRPAALAASEASQARAKRENAKHTPGPWTVLPEEADKDYLRIRGTRLGGRYKVANVHHIRYEGVHAVVRERDDAESMANARLIAAAPELLEALQGLVAVLDKQLHSPHAAARASPLGRARAAIAKATGDTE